MCQTNSALTGTKPRIAMLDVLRGIFLCAMILYHALYDVTLLFSLSYEQSNALLYHPAMRLVQTSIGCGFILLSGVSSRLSKSNIKRGLICLSCGVSITLVTYLLMPEELIVFGVLHLLGLSMILYGLLKKWIERISTAVFGASCFLLFSVSYYFVCFQGVFVPLDGAIGVTLFLFGAKSYSVVSSADYYPIMPWLWLFLLGTTIGKQIKNQRFPKRFYTANNRWLAVLGRHSLLIYLAHQPIVFALIWVLSLALSHLH